jgi:hypothetical protein
MHVMGCWMMLALGGDVVEVAVGRWGERRDCHRRTVGTCRICNPRSGHIGDALNVRYAANKVLRLL